MEWAGDAAGTLLYTQADELRRPAALFMHAPMAVQARDTLVFEEESDDYFVDVSKTKDDRFLTVNSNSKDCSEVWVASDRFRVRIAYALGLSA